jgi:hypothetical protein
VTAHHATIRRPLPASITRVAREATQPESSALLSYADYLARLDTLALSDRVHIEVIGRSHGDRAIPAIAITAPDAQRSIGQLQEQAAELAAPEVSHPNAAEVVIKRPRRTGIAASGRVPILLLSGNYGMEASQLEALLELAEALASDPDPQLAADLERLVVLIIPTINPDGREIALEQWARQPLGPALRSSGNFFEVQILREYLHLIEPETKALARFVAAWKPFLAWEVHEDAIGLGWGTPETCLAPPTSTAGGPGHGGMVDMPARPGDNDPRLFGEQQRYGASIAQAWARDGYEFLHDPNGAHGWPVWPGTGFEGLTTQPETRFTRAMALRGVASFITESCRIPGSQSWADRVGQKVSAGRAIVRTAAESREALVRIVGDVSDRGVAGDAGEAFYLLPADQDPFPLRRAVAILGAHGVSLYRAAVDGRECVVVPAAQPLRGTIEVLLSFTAGRHQSLVAALGLRVRGASSLGERERDSWAEVPLKPLIDVAPRGSRDWGRPSRDSYLSVGNTHEAATMVNRLLRLPGGEARWDVCTSAARGGFLLKIPADPQNRDELARGLDLVTAAASSADFERAAPLRQPRVGIYRGAGVTRGSVEGNLGRLRRLMTDWEFPFTLLSAKDLGEGGLAAIDVLLVPEGAAAEFRGVPDPDFVWHRYPWEFDEPYDPLGDREHAALRQWLEDGGSYVGIDAGGGLLAAREHLGLLDMTLQASALGVGLVELRLDVPDSPLFDGCGGSWDVSGSWRQGFLNAFYHSNPWFAEPGGCVFAPGDGAVSLASYYDTLPVEGLTHLRPIEHFGPPGRNSAIVTGRIGRGRATAFGIQPGFRCQYLSTARLIANAIFMHALPAAPTPPADPSGQP